MKIPRLIINKRVLAVKQSLRARINSLVRHFDQVLSLSIIFSSVLVSFGIIYASLGRQGFVEKFTEVIPRVPEYRFISELSDQDYNDISKVINSQPRISYNPAARYVLVESSDLDCPNCAKFHGFGLDDKSKSSFERLKKDFIVKGKLEYVFVDSQFLKDARKHNAMYCAGEQRAKAFFDYGLRLYELIDREFTDELASSIAVQLGLDGNKILECIKSNKYEDRIKKLTSFNSNVLGINGTPVFTLFEIQEQEIVGTDDKIQTIKTYQKLEQIVGNVDYKTTLKPALSKYTDK